MPDSPTYYYRRINLSRRTCTQLEEYFCLNEHGLLTSLNLYDDGLMYLSEPPRPFPLPVRAVPCSAEAYAAALAKCTAYVEEKKAKAQAEKDALKLLRGGMLRAAHAAEEAGAAEAAPLVVLPPEFLDDYTVVDAEYQAKDLLELAGARYHKGQLVAEMQSFVRFRGQVKPFTTELTGITSADVYDAPEAKQVLREFRKLAGDSLLVAHNYSADRLIIERTRAREGAQAQLANDWLCTLAVAKKRYEGPHNLTKLCERFGIPTDGAHRALNDVRMCAALLQLMHSEQPITAEAKVRLRATAATATLFPLAA